MSELVELTEYSRVYARRVLRQHGRRVQVGQQTLEADIREHSARCRSAYYDEKVKRALIKIWRVMDYICGKRLQPALPELVMVLERHNELQCEAATRAKLLRISAATIDRLLRTERRKYELRGQARPNGQSSDGDKGVMKIVMTGAKSDPVEWQTHIRSKKRRTEIAKRFKDPDDPSRL